MKRLLKLVPLLLVLLVAISAPIAAAVRPSVPTSSLAVTPPTFELTANPGDTIERSVRVDNLVDTPAIITVDRRNFAALGEEGQAELTDQDTRFSLASWISVDQETVTIPAKGSQVFNYTITIPANAEPGGHFGSIVFRTIPPSAADSGGYSVGQEIGTLILLKIAGATTEQAHIESFKPTQGFWEGGPIDFETRIKNEGDVHIRPTATITISNMFGQKVGVVPVDGRNILPDSIRKLPARWSGQGLFGSYTATLSVSYGGDRHILTSTTSFTVIPYKPILATLLVVGALGLTMYRGRRRIRHSLKVLLAKEKH